MAYTPINWQTGDTITAEKLNKMDNGWSMENTQLFSETVTMESSTSGNEAMLSYNELVSATTISVVFDTVEYSCPLITLDGGYGYGGVNSSWDYNFTDFPFAFISATGDEVTNILATDTSGTHTISVTAEDISISANFSDAVTKCVDIPTMPFLCVNGTTTLTDMSMAMASSKILYFWADNKCFIVTSFASNEINFIPSNAYISASFVDGVFTVTVS